jgi:hypothetical protein
MMKPVRRTFLGKAYGLGAGQRVYEIPGGLEVDFIDYMEVVRKRVFFEDVVFVSHHKYYGWAYMVLTGLLCGMFLLPAFFLMGSEPEAAMVWMFFASFGGIAFVLRLILGVDAITVYGNRSKAEIHFQFRKQRARELFRQLCDKVRDAQTAVAAEVAAQEETPQAEGPPMPPAPADGGAVV